MNLYAHANHTLYMQYLAAWVQLNSHRLHTSQSRNLNQACHKGCVEVLPFAGTEGKRGFEVRGGVWLSWREDMGED